MSAPMIINKFQKVCVNDAQGHNESHEIPDPRSGHRIVVTDGCLYSIGGYNPDFWGVDNDDDTTNYPLFRELWKFTFASRTWERLDALENMPYTLASHSAVLHRNKLVMFGGTSVPFGETSSNSVNMLNIKTLTWTQVDATGDLPIPSYGAGVCMIENYMYICGGTTGWEYNLDVRRLDLGTGEWEYLELDTDHMQPHIQPHERYRHEIATDGRKIYILGGGRATVVYSFEEMPAFDIKSRTWENVPTRPDPQHGYPLARRCHGCAQLRNDVYICGGYNGQDIYGDLWSINLQDMAWRKYNSTMPEPSYFHSTAITQSGCLYVFGGVVKLDVERTSHIYAIQLHVPSLREASWHVFSQHVRDIRHVPRNTLAQMGVPRDLIARIS